MSFATLAPYFPILLVEIHPFTGLVAFVLAVCCSFVRM